MADTVKHSGVIVNMGGRDWIVPALSLGQVRKLIPSIEKLTTSASAISDDVATAAVGIIQAALSRNYPDVTPEQVEDMIDLGNFRKIIDAIMGVSGLTQSGEAAGEASR